MEIKTYIKMLLKLLRLPIGISSAIISSLSFFPTAGAQDYPLCFMVSSSGQVVNLNNLCQKQALQQEKTCQGPFDSDGFPTAYASELESLKVAVAGARKRNVYPSEDPEVQSALKTLLTQMPFSTRTKELQSEQILLVKKLRTTAKLEETENIQQKFLANNREIARDLCFIQFVDSLNKKFRKNLFY